MRNTSERVRHVVHLLILSIRKGKRSRIVLKETDCFLQVNENFPFVVEISSVVVVVVVAELAKAYVRRIRDGVEIELRLLLRLWLNLSHCCLLL